MEKQVNVWREDQVKPEEMLNQQQALEGAEATFEGYFMVPLVVDRGDL